MAGHRAASQHQAGLSVQVRSHQVHCFAAANRLQHLQPSYSGAWGEGRGPQVSFHPPALTDASLCPLPAPLCPQGHDPHTNHMARGASHRSPWLFRTGLQPSLLSVTILDDLAGHASVNMGAAVSFMGPVMAVPAASSGTAGASRLVSGAPHYRRPVNARLLCCARLLAASLVQH
jgi:hypothetical protein